MRRLIAFIVAALATTFAASAFEQAIRNINVRVDLDKDGSACVTERWDVCVADGTEWYLVRYNLGDIVIRDLSVSDESGRLFENVGEWDVHKSLEQKAGKCGIAHTSDGDELCWGIGSYGDHVYTVRYIMTNVVKSLNDYDMLHLQLVSPGLSASPDNVTVRVAADSVALDTSNARAWGFGFVGSCEFSGGEVVYQSTERFRHGSSVIALLRFEKGLFDSTSRQARDFEDVYEKAVEGSDFDDDEEGFWLFLGAIAAIGIGSVAMAIVAKRKRRFKILGCKDKDIVWCREVPYGGNVLEADFILSKLGESRKGSSVASALILRMIYDGYLSVQRNAKGKVDIGFSGKEVEGLDDVSAELFNMMVDASGSDRILQDKEFSRWSVSHEKRVHQWVVMSERQARRQLAEDHFGRPGQYTKAGQRQARNLLGFKMFLSDFTLVSERRTPEVALWRDYLVFGALFGIADKVASELKDINPQFLESMNGFDNDTLGDVILRTNMLSRAIITSDFSYAASQSAKGGFGGGTSFGGGGGFSGGGFGGGSR